MLYFLNSVLLLSIKFNEIIVSKTAFAIQDVNINMKGIHLIVAFDVMEMALN